MLKDMINYKLLKNDIFIIIKFSEDNFIFLFIKYIESRTNLKGI